MKKAKNVGNKMRLAALKAWETRRKNKPAGDSSVRKTSKKEMEEKKKGKTVKDSVNEIREAEEDVGFKSDEKREMMALNGVELEQLAKKTQRHLDRKEAIDEAINGRKEKHSVAVGGIMKAEKIERFNGGISLVDA